MVPDSCMHVSTKCFFIDKNQSCTVQRENDKESLVNGQKVAITYINKIVTGF